MSDGLPKLGELRATLQAELLATLPRAAPGARAELQELYALLREYPLRGGKQLRGLLVLLSCAAHGGRWQDALGVAVALELFQNWVLIHDDIEDDSEERRGQAALHRLAGMPVALNVGDLLHLHMWNYLLERSAPLSRAAAIRQELAAMIARTAEGQHLDLSWVAAGRFDLQPEDYLEMVTLKTAHYTVIAPLRLGALAAGAEPDARLAAVGEKLGVAFQLRDDVLNLQPGEGYGKEFAGDLYEAKRTLILAHTFARATPAERAELKARLSKPREARLPEDIESCLVLIRRYGALEYAQSLAESYAQEGLELLREVLAGLANQRVARELSGLLESLALRRR